MQRILAQYAIYVAARVGAGEITFLNSTRRSKMLAHTTLRQCVLGGRQAEAFIASNRDTSLSALGASVILHRNMDNTRSGPDQVEVLKD